MEGLLGPGRYDFESSLQADFPRYALPRFKHNAEVGKGFQIVRDCLQPQVLQGEGVMN